MNVVKFSLQSLPFKILVTSESYYDFNRIPLTRKLVRDRLFQEALFWLSVKLSYQSSLLKIDMTVFAKLIAFCGYCFAVSRLISLIIK